MTKTVFRADPLTDVTFYRTGSLPSSMLTEEINARLGFGPNAAPSHDGKSTTEWRGYVNDEPFAIWDFKGEQWSVYDPSGMLVASLGIPLYNGRTESEWRELARGNVERNIEVEDDASPDSVYEEAFTLALDKLHDEGAPEELASRIASEIAQGYAQP